MANVFLEMMPVRKQNIKRFLEKNSNKISEKKLMELLDIVYQTQEESDRKIIESVFFNLDDSKISEEIIQKYPDCFDLTALEKVSDELKYRLFFDVKRPTKGGYDISEKFSEELTKKLLLEKYDKLKEIYGMEIINKIMYGAHDDNFIVDALDLVNTKGDKIPRLEIVIKHISNEKIREDMLDKYAEQLSGEIASIIDSFSSKKIMELIEKYSDRINNLPSLISNIDNEQAVEFIKKYANGLNEGEVDRVVSKMSDAEVESFLENEDYSVYANYFSSLIKRLSDDKVMDYIIKNESRIDEILEKCIKNRSDDFIKSVIDNFSDKLGSVRLLYNACDRIEDTQTKIDYLFKFGKKFGYYHIMDMIDTISLDILEKNLNLYEEELSDELIAEIIKKMDDDSKKVEYTRKYMNKIGIYISGIINGIEDINSKVQILKFFETPITSLDMTSQMLNTDFIKNMYLKQIREYIKEGKMASDEECIKALNYLFETNDEINKTLDYGLFIEKNLNLFKDKNGNYSTLRVIGRNHDLQSKILKLSDKNYLLCKIFLDTVINNEYDYTHVLQTMAFKLNDDIIEEITKRNLSEEEIRKIIEKMVYISSNLSTNDFKTIDEIRDVESILEKHSNEMLKSFNIEDVRKSALLKRYGIDVATANNLMERFAYDLDTVKTYDDPMYEKIKILLYDIKSILNETDIRQLRALAYQGKSELDFDSMVVFEAICRKMYGNQISNSLSTVDDMKKTDNKISSCKQDIYFAYDEEKQNDFCLMFTSLGAYREYKRPDNYMEDWLRPKLGTHGFCASMMSNQMMGTARIKYAVLGFSKFPAESLLLQAPYDLVSENTEIDAVTDDAYDRTMFLSPKAMIDNTRHTHNELSIERLVEDGKLKPDYVLFTTEEYDKEKYELFEKIQERDVIERYNASENKAEMYDEVKNILKKYGVEFSIASELADFTMEYQIFVNTVQAANDFNIPIVVVERKKIREHERKTIDNMMEDFQKNHDARTMTSMLTRFVNNRAGSRLYYVCDGFEESDAMKIISQVQTEILNEISNGNLKQSQILLNSLKIWCKLEVEKQPKENKAPGTTLPKIPDFGYLGFDMSYFNEIIDEVQQRIDEKKKELGLESTIQTVSDADYDKEIEEIKKSKFNPEKRLNADQYTIEEVEEKHNIVDGLVKASIEDSNRNSSYDPESKSHGKRHVQDVILFTALVGQKSLTGENKDELLKISLEASKYHDCGRENDRNTEHSEKGANKSFEVLSQSGNYNAIELSMIYTAIANHEFRDYRCSSMDELKEKLVEENERKFKESFMSIVKTGKPNEKVEYTEDEYKKALSDKSLVGDINTENIIEDVSQVVTLIRDADALDRTRFLDSSRASLNPDYLSDEAKKFVEFSYSLAEHHATKDLEQMISDGKLTPDIINRIKNSPSSYVDKPVKFSIKTNKELIKFIRDNNLYFEGVSYK